MEWGRVVETELRAGAEPTVSQPHTGSYRRFPNASGYTPYTSFCAKFAMTKKPETKPPESEPAPAPLSLKETFSILVAGHIGVRRAEQRAEDFRRASGLRIFIAAALYFFVIVAGLIMFVRYVTS